MRLLPRLPIFGIPTLFFSTAIVVSNDCPILVKTAARLAHFIFGDLVGVCDGVADDVEIQAAIGALTAGRTWKETVVFIGSFSPSAAVSVPSYTILDLRQAKLTLANGANSDIYTVVTNATDIELEGGLLDGNRLNQIGGYSGIMIRGSTDVKIHGTKVTSCYRHNITLEGGSRYQCSDLILLDAGQFNFYTYTLNGIGYVTKSQFNNIIGIGSGKVDPMNGSSILFANLQDCEIDNIYAEDALTGGGIDINTCSYLSVGLLTAYNNNWLGVEISNTRHSTFGAIVAHGNLADGLNLHTSCYNVTIAETVLYQNNTAGGRISDSYRINILGGHIFNNSQAVANARSGMEINNSVNCMMQNLHALDDQDPKTQKYGIEEIGTSDWNFIYDNDVIPNATAGIAVLGAHTKVRRNNGFTTENSGSSTGTGAQQTIAHGLAFTPTRQQIALFAGSATALPFHSADPDATNIYVTAALNQPWYWATVGQ